MLQHSTIGGPGPNLTVDELKTVLDTEDDLIAQESRRKQIYQEFQSAPLETIMHKAHSRVGEKISHTTISVRKWKHVNYRLRRNFTRL